MGGLNPFRPVDGGRGDLHELDEVLLPNNNILKEIGDLIRRMLESSHEGSCFMADIVFAPRQVARKDREFQRVIEIFVWIALQSIGR